ncbi:hypothetical protein DL767_006955 [Monosporascus sp. MG133]|nr:hypothetical protein DL767_006955 [Monosporascus sp. MG133]
MKRNPDLRQSLPSKAQAELESRDDYVALTRQIESLSLQIKTAADQAALAWLKDERSKAYKSRAQLEHEEREKFRQSQNILHPLRWKHVFNCYESFLKKACGYAQFCFLCSQWINSETEWERDRQTHIDIGDAPSRCDPVIFRHAVACAGYCPVHLGDEGLPACERLQQFTDRSAWRRHISRCIPDYVASTKPGALISCPMSCRGTFHSEADLWHHLGDMHSAHLPRALKKRKSCADSDDEKDLRSSSSAKKREIFGVPADRRRRPHSPKNPVSVNLVNTSAENTGARDFIRDGSGLTSSSFSIGGENHNVRNGSVASISTFGATEQQGDIDSSGTNTSLSSLFNSDTEIRDESLSELSIYSPSTSSQTLCEGDSCSEISDSAMLVDILTAFNDTGSFQEKWIGKMLPKAPT